MSPDGNRPGSVVSWDMEKSTTLVYSDNKVGCDRFGFIDRKPGEDPDDEDHRYQSHVRKVSKDNTWRCVEGILFYGVF